MPNVFEFQILKDTTEKSVIKLTGEFDGSGQEANTVRIQANTLYGALNANAVPGLLSTGGSAKTYYDLQVSRIWYDVDTAGDVELFWNASTTRNIASLNGAYNYNELNNWVTIPNNAAGTAGCKGDIGIVTRGMVANSSYTIIIELRKNNADYQRGQFNDPAAFNYPPYDLTP